ncbi:MAG: hypothetical protein Q7S57_04775 [bacterium]|nr:hypothetical protein [bacterium]
MAKSQFDLCTAPNLSYLRLLTTEKGIWQHTKGSEPDLAMGYSIDDIARALIVVNKANQLFPELNKTETDPRDLEQLAEVYLKYISHNQEADGSFHNFDSAEGTPLDKNGSEDSYGRTIWALGDTMKNGITEKQRSDADAIFMKACGFMINLEHVRSNCFVILGIISSLAHERIPERYDVMKKLVGMAIEQFKKERTSDWRWFEKDMSYSNGAIPLALLRASQALLKTDPILAEEAKTVALDALGFLLVVMEHNGHPSLIGNMGWHGKGKQKALFDQQPVDAAAMVLACLEAYKVTGHEHYKESAENWLTWYEGNNIIGRTMLKDNGAVYDGIQEDRVNINCGAESIVTYLLARLRWAEVVCKS